ncbi:tRNA 2'-phosphotransferase 1 [Haplosporangium sp. Z 27]|nr:tRNA 2'-phosphotransferase 1 [Haplosporangium sp. Z 27]
MFTQTSSSSFSGRNPSASGSNTRRPDNRNRGPRDESPTVRLSKSLTWLLRHNAESQGVAIRPDGYVKLQDVLGHSRFKGYTLDDILQVVDASDKKRFQILEDEAGKKVYIRAVQGHSITKVAELGFEEIIDATKIPIAVHGTMRSNWDAIRSQGLSKMARNHIHMAIGLPGDSGVISGMRNACNLYIYIDTAKAIKDGVRFYKTSNNVILSDGKNGDGFITKEYFSRVAHRYANAAEEYRDQNRWEEAADMHLKAADQFLLATKDTQNQDVIRTLKLMNANHTRQGKGLQRKIAKATAEAAAAAAAVQPQQKPQSDLDTNHSKSSTRLTRSSSSASTGNTESGGAGITGSTAGRRRNSGQRQANISLPHDLGNYRLDLKGDVGPDASYLDGTSGTSSSSSSAMIEESYTLIKNHAKDDSDPFNKFWEAVENLVLKISSPVAFTTIPLDGDDSLPPHSTTSEEEPSAFNPTNIPFAAQDGRRATDNTLRVSSNGRARQSKVHEDSSHMQESFFFIDSPSSSNSQPKAHSRSRSIPISDTDSISTGSGRPTSINKRSGSVGSASGTRYTKTLEEYAIENQQLKATLDKLSKRNLKLEKNLEGVMQMSIWTKDVQRSAMQLIKSQDVLRPMKQSIQDLSGGNILPQRKQAAAGLHSSISSNSFIGMNPGIMQARLQELEAEVLQLKEENSKINSLMKKYKQRWEDLKESAKKRRNAASTPSDGGSEDTSNLSFDSNSGIPGLDGLQSPQRPILHEASTVGAYPYSSSSLVGNPNSLSPSSGGSNGGFTRPLSSRSASAPGTGLAAGGGYQRRILMDNMTGGIGLETTPLNTHRQSSRIVSSTSPRVLDSSPRTNLSGLASVSDVQRPSSVVPITSPFSIAPSATANAHIITAASPQLGNHAMLSPPAFSLTSNPNASPKLSSDTSDKNSSSKEGSSRV